MWRPTFTLLKRAINPTPFKNIHLFKLYRNGSNLSHFRSTKKLTLVSASIGVLVGAAYGGFTHYQVNAKRRAAPLETDEYSFFQEAPKYKAQFKVINEGDTSNLHLVLFQYSTCPFCCKVRAYLDSRGVSYEIVEVDAVLRQAIKWSPYKKVPILLSKVDGGYQQLLDSTAIISVLETYLRDNTQQTELQEIIKFYPVTKYKNESGKQATDIANKYFIMHNDPLPDESDKSEEIEERKWRQWADRVLVHTLSPNVYRTAGEAVDTFKWFEQAGGWRQMFPGWECMVMVYGGAAAMYVIAKRLKTRHSIKHDPRESLYDAANTWTAAIKKKGTPFLGGDKPNLADITVYGVFSSIEGCQAFQDLRDNTEIGKWYDDIKATIQQKKGKVIAVYA